MGLLFFVFVWFSRGFLENQKNLRENQTYQRRPKKTKQTWGKPTNTVVKGFRPTLGYGFVFCVLLFSRGFLEKQKNLRENQTY